MHDEKIGSSLVNLFAGESKWTRSGENCAPRSQFESGDAMNVVKLPSRIRDVVFGTRRLHVNVVFATLQSHVTGRDCFTGTRVVANLVGIEDVIAKINLCIAVQHVHRAGLLELVGDDVAEFVVTFQNRCSTAIGFGWFCLWVFLMGLLRVRGDSGGDRSRR